MDEYLFVVLAKLKADRIKLQREQRAEGFGRYAIDDELAPSSEVRSPRARRFDPALEGFES